MDRKKSLTTAALVSGAVFAATAAIGLNVGILSSGADQNKVGSVTADDLVPVAATTPSTEPVTVYVDDYVTEPATPEGPASSQAGSGVSDRQAANASDDQGHDDEPATPAPATPPTTTAAPPVVTDPGTGEHEDDDHAEDPDHEEFEGHDDDD